MPEQPNCNRISIDFFLTMPDLLRYVGWSWFAQIEPVIPDGIVQQVRAKQESSTFSACRPTQLSGEVSGSYETQTRSPTSLSSERRTMLSPALLGSSRLKALVEPLFCETRLFAAARNQSIQASDRLGDRAHPCRPAVCWILRNLLSSPGRRLALGISDFELSALNSCCSLARSWLRWKLTARC